MQAIKCVFRALNVLLWSSTFVVTQSFGQFSYFPLSVGNEWFFSYGWDGRIEYKLEIQKDTTLSDGYSYAKLNFYWRNSDSSFILQSEGYSYLRTNGDTVIEYPHNIILKFDMNIGDSVLAFGPGPNKVAVVLMGRDTENVFGRNLLTYALYSTPYDYYTFSDSVGFNTLWATTWHNWLPEYLLGCVIDGHVYGNTITTDVRGENTLTPRCRISQNYPNPFNPTTNILFTIPSRSFVSLKVYDLLGKEVAILVFGELPSGDHLRQWNAAKMPSGVYFCRMQAGLFTETKKLLLLR